MLSVRSGAGPCCAMYRGQRRHVQTSNPAKSTRCGNRSTTTDKVPSMAKARHPNYRDLQPNMNSADTAQTAEKGWNLSAETPRCLHKTVMAILV